MNKKDKERAYERLMGKEALERQKALAKDHCPYCGTRKPNHNPLCRQGVKTI